MRITASICQNFAAGLVTGLLVGAAMAAPVSADSQQAGLHRNPRSLQTAMVSQPSTVPGDNGEVQVHDTATAPNDRRNEPKVCAFYLDAFGFDGLQAVQWHITQQTHGATALSGSLTLSTEGTGYSQTYQLPNGQYKLYWNFAGEHGAAKHKVFTVACPSGSVQGTTTTPPVTGGRGGDHDQVVATSGGHVLGASTTAAVASSQLVNTGNSSRLATVLALSLIGLAGLVSAIRREPVVVASE